MDLQALQRSSWEVAESKGFHDAQEELPRSTLALYLRLLLTIGELSEAAEELRDGRDPAEVYYEFTLASGRVLQGEHPFGELKQYRDGSPPKIVTSPSYFDGAMIGKPAGFGIELADAQIRLADLAESCGVSLSKACEEKESYNKTRAFLHGKKA